MLCIEPPLDGTPDLNANEVPRLIKASQLVSEEHGGEVAEIWSNVDRQGSKY